MGTVFSSEWPTDPEAKEGGRSEGAAEDHQGHAALTPSTVGQEKVRHRQEEQQAEFRERLLGIIRGHDPAVSATVLNRVLATATNEPITVFPQSTGSPSLFRNITPSPRQRISVMQAWERDREHLPLCRGNISQLASFPGDEEKLAREIWVSVRGILGEVALALWERAKEAHGKNASRMSLEEVASRPPVTVAEREKTSSKAAKRQSPPKQEPIPVHIRWMIRRDLPEVLQIETAGTDYPWCEEDFLQHLRQKNSLGMVAEREEHVVGYIIYALEKKFFGILRCAVAKEARGASVGTQLIQKVQGKLSTHRRAHIIMDIPRGDDGARAFLEKQGFGRAKTVGRYERMTYSLRMPHCSKGIIERVFGEEILKEAPDASFRDSPRVLLEHLWKVVGEDKEKQEQALENVRHWFSTPDSTLAEELIREGWRHMLGIREVRDAEFVQWLRHRKESYAGDGAATARKRGGRKRKELVEVIGCDRLRSELERSRSLGQYDALDAKERAIAHEVFAEVQRYRWTKHRATQLPGYMGGTPRETVALRMTNCMSSCWLMAALLLRCGIRERQLFYCTVHEFDPHMAHFAGHGSLLLATARKELLLFDGHFGRVEGPLRMSFCENSEERDGLQNLLEGKDNGAIVVRVPPTYAQSLSLPRNMQVMPLVEGFASNHLLNVGLSFSAEGHIPEARRSHELALTFNPQSTHALYHYGLLAFQEGDLVAADWNLRSALEVYEGNLLAHFTLGELCLEQDNATEAREHFSRVLSDPREEIWGDDGVFRSRVKRYLSFGRNADLLKEWNEGGGEERREGAEKA